MFLIKEKVGNDREGIWFETESFKSACEWAIQTVIEANQYCENVRVDIIDGDTAEVLASY